MEDIRKAAANPAAALAYPFDAGELLRTRRKLKKALLADGRERIEKKIAVLGGSTTNDVCDMLELFLLAEGIRPVFYQSEYAKYWEDAMFGNPTLEAFAPDVVYVHTTFRNLAPYLPHPDDSAEAVEGRLVDAERHFSEMWERLSTAFACPIVQNNFEYPFFRLYGNRDATDIHGQTNFVNRLNARFQLAAAQKPHLFIHDLSYTAACYGLDRWADQSVWYMYKYAMALEAIPSLAHSVASIIKSIFGRNKKVLALDMDNTLWGGVVGDDGPEGLDLGEETPNGQAFLEFQRYVKRQKDIGVLLTVCSKNDPENALAGLRHPDSALSPDDFQVIRANWEPKDRNIAETAHLLNLMTDSVVFADDNPAERHIVAASLPSTAVPAMEGVENYIRILDRNAYFEVTSLSADDLRRNEMYKENALREAERQSFADYSDYLRSLEMQGEIRPFSQTYMQRIAQLTNKSNQFNLTTRRYTAAEIAAAAASPTHITLYGRLTDRFGDNGVVAVVIGEIRGSELHIDLWLMSCRVLKRDMEYAMLDTLVETAVSRGITKLVGYYYPTAKNGMVRELYADFGFAKTADNDGSTVWELETAGYTKKNRFITVNGGAI